MNACQILTQVEAAGIKLWLGKFGDGGLAIGCDDPKRIKPFKKMIASHRDNVIALLKARLPVPRKKFHSAIALEHALQWLVEIPDDVDRLVSAPSSCRWLTGWLTPAKQREWQLNTEGGDDGKLSWDDWKEVVGRVETEFEGLCQNANLAVGGRLRK